MTYKHNRSGDNTTVYLYTKIVYFVRATCFDHIRSSSEKRDPRVVYVSLYCEVPNDYKFLSQNCKIHKIVYAELV